MILSLTDSKYTEGVELHYKGHCVGFMNTVDELAKQFNGNTIQIIHLHPSMRLIQEKECPIWYQVTSYTSIYYKPIVEKCTFYTSHYIGIFSYNGYTITITPRFNQALNYIMGYAANLFIPNSHTEISKSLESNPYWLLAILWKSMLNKALTTGQIPRKYNKVQKNQTHFRGRLCINKHIRANITNQARFYCSYQQLSMDNTINRTICHTYRILNQKGVGSIISDFAPYINHLQSMGVKDIMENTKLIDNINYSRFDIAYKPLMQLSKSILSANNTHSIKDANVTHGISYLIDMAELWEMYLFKLLQKNLSPTYTVYSPNLSQGENLLKNIRQIRPDIIILKDNKPVMIIDAKYKHYATFGQTAQYGVSRDDLYQMTTYLYHYGQADTPITGIFTAPIKLASNNGKEIYTFTQHPSHQIGLVNLNIDDNTTPIKEKEKQYIDTIKSLLASPKS